MAIMRQISILTFSFLAIVCNPVFGQNYTGWLDKDSAWEANKSQLQDFGEQFESALDLYHYLEQQADGGDRLGLEKLAEPAYDWSGIYTRTGGGLSFDPDIRASETTAILTSTGTTARQRKIDQLAATGGE